MGLKPELREAADLVVWVTVDDIEFALATGFNAIKVFYDTSTTGNFTDALSDTIPLEANTTEYRIYDSGGTSGRYYKAALHDTGSAVSDGPKSDERLYGTRCAYASSHDVRRELSAASGKSALSPRHGHTIWQMAEDASRLIDRLRHLLDGAYEAVDSATYYFDGNGEVQLWLPIPVLSITTLSVEETDGSYTEWTEDTDFFVWPYNVTPTLRLDVNRKTGTTKSTWTNGPKRVKIVGVFGVSSSPPSEISRAVLIQCARWYKRAMQGWSDVGGTTEAGELIYTKRLDADVETLVLSAVPHEVRL